MEDRFLTREEVIQVIEGRGNVHRVPMIIHHWIDTSLFGERKKDFDELLSNYPNDIIKIVCNMPEVFDAPEDDPHYRWMNYTKELSNQTALDSVIGIEDWSQLDGILSDFPNPYSEHLFPEVSPDDGRYRVCTWWFWLFERLWSVRGMENALCDFYEYPDEVHRLFRAFTDFYKVVLTRARVELNADGIFVTDDIGTQTGPFFSLDIFKEFFQPYYAELIDHCHDLGMHFWLHSCGHVKPYIPELIKMNLDVLHPIQKYTMDEAEIATLYGGKLCLWAGFDVQHTIPYGTPDDVRTEVHFMYDTYVRKDGRFMIALGNNLTPDTPYESLKALLDEALSYGISKISE